MRATISQECGVSRWPPPVLGFDDRIAAIRDFLQEARDEGTFNFSGAVLVDHHDGLAFPRSVTRILGKAGIPIMTQSGPADAWQSLLGVVDGAPLEVQVLIPDMYFMESQGHKDLKAQIVAQMSPPGKSKSDIQWANMMNQVVFRGSSTGFISTDVQDLLINPNDRFAVALKSRNSSCIDAAVSLVVQQNEEVAKAVHELGLVKEPMSQHAMMQYKGILDIDGNTNSWGIWKWLSKSGEKPSN